MRDFQRARLYEAENVLKSDVTYPHKIHFRSFNQINQFVQRVIESDLWRQHNGPSRVEVLLGRRDSGKAKAYRLGGTWRGQYKRHPFITLPPTWATNNVILIHELAHMLASDGHGPKYCRAYLDLVHQFIGSQPARTLRTSMEKHGVQFHEPQWAIKENDKQFLRLLGIG